MVRGYCIQCNRQVGGFRGRIAWQCQGCRKLYCETCPKKKVGRLFKKLVCPECRIEMHEGGVPVLRNAKGSSMALVDAADLSRKRPPSSTQWSVTLGGLRFIYLFGIILR